MGIAEKSLTLRHLRYFVVAADEGSLAGAARRLHVAQPALSRQIHELERVCGRSLFVREHHGVSVTPTGSELLLAARELRSSLAAALDEARRADAGMVGRLRIGIGRLPLHSPKFGHALSAVRERFPDVELVISEAPTLSQPQLLLSRALDIAIGMHGSAEPADIIATKLYDDAIDSVLLSASHPLAARPWIDLDALRGSPLVNFDTRVAASIPELFRALEHAGFHAWEMHENAESIFTQVAAGRGWSVAPRSFRDQPPPGTVVRPLRGFSVACVIAARRRTRDDSALTKNIVEALADSIREDNDSAPAKEPATPRPAPRAADLPHALEIRHLRAIGVLSEEGSLRAAAQRLGLTQSGLSRQLAALERAVGARLTSRVGTRLVLTPAGRRFQAQTHDAVKKLDRTLRNTARAHHVAKGCTIGVVPSELTGDFMLAVLRKLGQQQPTLVPEVRELLTSRQADALRARTIDVGIAGAFPSVDEDAEIAFLCVLRDVIDCVLLGQSHPLARRGILDPRDLRDLPFVFVSRAAYPRLYDTVMQALAHIGLTPEMEAVDGARAIWRMVADTNSWSIGVSSMRTRPPAGLVAIPVRGLEIEAPVHLLWRREEQDPDVLSVVEAFRAGTVTGRPQTATVS